MSQQFVAVENGSKKNEVLLEKKYANGTNVHSDRKGKTAAHRGGVDVDQFIHSERRGKKRNPWPACRPSFVVWYAWDMVSCGNAPPPVKWQLQGNKYT